MDRQCDRSQPSDGGQLPASGALFSLCPTLSRGCFASHLRGVSCSQAADKLYTLCTHVPVERHAYKGLVTVNVDE
eukprot:6177684-Pleurochrysis_carterae.AAC.3